MSVLLKRAGFTSISRPLLESTIRRRGYASQLNTPSFTKPSPFGQPYYLSHPNLVKKNEVTPGFTLAEYRSRRARLMEKLPESSMVVAVAANVQYMSGEIFYKFRQASNLWYLTGFQEPESAVILENTSSGCKMTLFCRGKDPAKEKWEGSRTDFDMVAKIFGADDVLSIDDFPSYLKSMSSCYPYVYADSANSSKRGRQQKSILNYLSSPSGSRNEYDGIINALSSSKRKNLAEGLGKMRAIKSEAEQRVMKEAAQISGRAHAKTMRFTKPGMSEAALAAHFEYICALNGAQRPAYVPVVASGANALIIHYTANDQIVRDGEMVLIDAGGEYNGYASDITRTYPANGSFTEPQRDLYAAVLSAQKALVLQCTEAADVSLDALHRLSCTLLRTELNQIGFRLSVGDLERVLYPHYLSHPIGIDLHESKYFDRNAPLVSGMVVTIEPGIYVPPSPLFPKHFHDIGIRIEDEVLVGKEHPVVLSVAAPKEIVDVEGACQGLIGLEPY
ncbi:peptidase M24 [Fomitiporia mediterranea MF3/22]|uniref:peptidase M24 n=1 Tax=Fomitiporia mediterranea (strain MF3/22) TaxID=694068 RepID=UPI0004409235|nr:peptidase M24 [Fomitiporia mediterranea MF3/22]EJD00812.1 peptidase M24 [Fomitiporia mediterranea MF3/22]